jgi:methylase of polypeptide subunit release factors
MSSINFRYDIVVSNPPYIASNDIKKLTEDVKSYDPSSPPSRDNNGS